MTKKKAGSGESRPEKGIKGENQKSTVKQKKSDVKSGTQKRGLKKTRQPMRGSAFLESLKEVIATAPKPAPLIYQRISAVMADIEAIKKTREADMGYAGKYLFRGIDDVYNSLHESMSEHKVFTVSDILEMTAEEHRTSSNKLLVVRLLKIKYTFYTEDGSHVSSTVMGEGMDSGDKGCNKAMAVAHKYALLQAFCIPTEEKKDPEADAEEFVADEEEKKTQQKASRRPVSSKSDKESDSGIKDAPKDINFNLMDGKKVWSNWYDILGYFADMKKILGQNAYYVVLNKHGASKANKIRKHEFQKIYDDLCFAVEAGQGEGKMEEIMSPEDAAAKAQKLILELVDKHGADPLKIPAELKKKYGVTDLNVMDPDSAEQVVAFLETALNAYRQRDKKNKAVKKTTAELRKNREENKEKKEKKK